MHVGAWAGGGVLGPSSMTSNQPLFRSGLDFGRDWCAGSAQKVLAAESVPPKGR